MTLHLAMLILGITFIIAGLDLAHHSDCRSDRVLCAICAALVLIGFGSIGFVMWGGA